MKVVRIYTGADNQTHFEELPLETFATLAAQVGTGPVRLNQGPAKSVTDFHNAPRRQYVVMMAGQLEIEIGDGTKRVLDPGARLGQREQVPLQRIAFQRGEVVRLGGRLHTLRRDRQAKTVGHVDH